MIVRSSSGSMAFGVSVIVFLAIRLVTFRMGSAVLFLALVLSRFYGRYLLICLSPDLMGKLTACAETTPITFPGTILPRFTRPCEKPLALAMGRDSTLPPTSGNSLCGGATSLLHRLQNTRYTLCNTPKTLALRSSTVRSAVLYHHTCCSVKRYLHTRPCGLLFVVCATRATCKLASLMRPSGIGSAKPLA